MKPRVCTHSRGSTMACSPSVHSCISCLALWLALRMLAQENLRSGLDLGVCQTKVRSFKDFFRPTTVEYIYARKAAPVELAHTLEHLATKHISVLALPTTRLTPLTPTQIALGMRASHDLPAGVWKR